MAEDKLFTPLTAGGIEMKNRIVMAPLTRNRARHEDDAPHALNAEYYAQRASGGLIISEATQISPEGKGYAFTPGIYSDAQREGWANVVTAVHEAGGKIVAQLWHVGRVSHTSLQPAGAKPVSASASSAGVQTFDGEKMVDTSEARALETSEIPRLVADFRHAAQVALQAGFDGVEVHAANGYLIEQFLRETSNKRDDDYGGPVENRARLLFEVLDAVVDVWGADRVGIRLSPFSPANGMELGDAQATYSYVVQRLNGYSLAYLHAIEGATGGSRDLPEGMSLAALRTEFDGVWIGNNSYDRALAIEAVENGDVDAVAFGRAYIANPDLAERLEQDAPLNEPNPETFYGGGAEGYTDYPFLKDSAA
ncbi:alkene reductase [Mesobaculum littorinae]|uniref:Alkene reductase n=1 Tax=Mesobaculum littorinae TaxID=2486419 RepID=A0A438AM76_9RHOB|nr:alkene reductase [Mesobaculum littorinae]RVV99754.1 alkene reductase [Mesobaculum littorinae]